MNFESEEMENESKLAKERSRGLLLASSIQMPAILVLTYDLVKFMNGTLTVVELLTLLIVSIACCIGIIVCTKKRIGNILALGLGAGTLIYALGMAALYFVQ